RERKVLLTVQGAGIESQMLSVITRPGLKPGKGRDRGWFRGPTFDVLVGPGKDLVGTVKIRGTGKPAAGVRISCGQCSGQTDEQGRFRLEGLRKQDRYFGWASGPGYFDQLFEARDSPGRDAIRVDLQVQRGVTLSGQLLDRATGKPVSGVVTYYIKPDNPNLK